MTKFYIGIITERNGNLEYDSKFLFITEDDPEEYMETTAMKWRGSNENDYDINYEGYWSDQTLITNGGCNEIPEEDFKILQKYLVVL